MSFDIESYVRRDTLYALDSIVSEELKATCPFRKYASGARRPEVEGHEDGSPTGHDPSLDGAWFTTAATVRACPKKLFKSY
jgi:hypothetical protein